MRGSEKALKLRPHHGMCMAYFEGKGYSSEFTEHMAEVIGALQKGGKIVLAEEADEICLRCPNQKEGVCRTEEKVRAYDEAVLKFCGLREGQEIEGKEFFQAVRKNVLDSGRRAGVCGDCQWDAVCRKK